MAAGLPDKARLSGGMPYLKAFFMPLLKDTERGNKMSVHAFEKRFGFIAVKKGFISVEELIEAMAIQIREELAKRRHRPIGQILVDLDYLSTGQVREVLEAIGLKADFWQTFTQKDSEVPNNQAIHNPSAV